jgi:hypothetical protein
MKTHGSKLVKSAEEFVQQPHQFLSCALRREHRETDNVSKKNTEIFLMLLN